MPLTIGNKDLEVLCDALFTYRQLLVEYDDDDYDDRIDDKVKVLTKLLERSNKAYSKTKN